MTRWIVRPPARSAQPYLGCDFGDDARVTVRLAGVRELLAACLAAAVALGACLGPDDATVTPTPEGSTGATASLAASPAGSATLAPVLPAPSSPPPLAAKPAPCPGTDKTPGAAPGRQVTGSSSNWSGYVAAVSKTSVTCVEGSWVEPHVTCGRTGHQAVATWVGIDGFSARVLKVPSTDVLVQIGTQVDCNNGVASHSAWHEILPGETSEISIPGEVRAGDHISAKVSYTNGNFVLELYDAETQLSFSLRANAPGAPRHSAEWIVEAPALHCPDHCAPVPLPDFDTVKFTGAFATVARQRGSISNDSWAHVKLGMVRSDVTRTTTSRLYTGGTVFVVTWVHR